MSDAQKPDLTQPKPFLRAALAHVRRHAGRELRFVADGVQMVGPFGHVDPVTREGAPPAMRAEDIAKYLESRAIYGDGFRKEGDEREFDGLGIWVISQADDGTLTVKTKKPTAPCIEAVVPGDVDELARLRSLYQNDAVDVYVLCEGKTRSRELAMAISAERRYLGLPTTLDVPPERSPYNYREYPDDHRGPEPFDAPQAGANLPWTVTFIGNEDEGRFRSYYDNPFAKAIKASDKAAGGRILVADNDRNSWNGRKMLEALDGFERPSVLVQVSIEKSAAVTKVHFSQKALALTTTEPSFENAPWDILAERKAARLKGRPPAPKTWHGTTELVAEAFVAREAPRGYVSGKALFFHGPVAYSQWDDCAIAAFVDTPDGVPTMFFGRDTSIGGGKSAIMSMAMGDISKAAGDRFRIVRIDDFEKVLKVGDKGLQNYAWTNRNQKKEAEAPRNAEVDEKAFGAWFTKKHERLTKAMKEAYRTKVTYATNAQYQSEIALVRHAEFRDEMASLFGIGLPSVGDAAAYRADAASTRERMDEREAEIKAKREAKAAAARASDEADEVAAPRM